MVRLIKTGFKDDLLKVQIVGSATWENAKYFVEYIKKLIREGKNKVLVDFSECVYLDSTYFGVLAELSEFVRSVKDGELFAANVSPKLYADMQNIGLLRILSVADENFAGRFKDIEATPAQFDENYSKIQRARYILKAHEVLENLSDQNKMEFDNVLKYFSKYVEEHKDDDKKPCP
jgi:anti-sigma B factor antagonist